MGTSNPAMAIILRWLSYPGSFDRENDRECLNWRLYGGGALIKVADSAISNYDNYLREISQGTLCRHLSDKFVQMNRCVNLMIIKR